MLKRTALFILILMVSIIAKEVKIGYIDSERIYQGFQETTNAKTAMEKELAKYKKTADSLKMRLDSAETEYESQKLMLSDAGKVTKQTEIAQMRKEYNQYLESVWGKSGKIEQKNRELLTPIVAKINEAVERIAKEEGFTLILDAAESKIVYAELGLDLTDLVLEELNKEYKPIEPDIEERKFLVFPFFESNTEAQQDRLGETVRANIFNLLRTQPKIEMISRLNVQSAMQTRNLLEGVRIEEKDIYEMGRELLADYVISGTVSKQGRRIDIEAVISDPKQQLTLGTEKGDVPREEELRPSLSNIIRELVRKTEKK
jgi:outer membrane protein